MPLAGLPQPVTEEFPQGSGELAETNGEKNLQVCELLHITLLLPYILVHVSVSCCLQSHTIL